MVTEEIKRYLKSQEEIEKIILKEKEEYKKLRREFEEIYEKSNFNKI